MNKVVSRIAKACIVFLLWMCCYGAYAQQNGVAPSLTPVKSADNGIRAEMQQLDRYKQNNKEAVQQLQAFTDNYSGHKTTTGIPDTTCTITIPVVIHVFHPAGSLGVPMSQINYAMNDLNVNFAGADADYTTVDPTFAAVKSYTKFRWKLAQTDPKGNPTTGVVYYQDKQSGFGNGTGYDKEIRTCAWDNKKYFNIYVMNDLYANNVTNNSGVAWYPNTTMSDSQVAREVYNYVYLGSGGSSYGYLEFNETFTHEAGHWLNLAHTFDGLSCSGPGDYVADTPPTDSIAAGCNGVRCGGPINGENYMDYNNTCLKNFTIGQNTRMEAAAASPSRFSIWQYDNLVATGVLSPTSTNPCVMANKFFAYSKTMLDEDVANNGTIEAPPVKIYACAGTQFVKLGMALTAGSDYTIINVPAGLTASIVTAPDGKSATLTFSGSAVAHDAINSVSNVVLTFTNPAVVGGAVSAITNYTTTFQIRFKDPWTYTCDSLNISATSLTTWTRFETAGPIPRYYGLWYDAGSYYLENYGRAIITAGSGSDNIIFLPAGTSIGPSGPWRAGGSQGVLYSSSYPALDGTTGYVGFRMQAGNDFYYGWMHISVSSTTGITLINYQYCNKPNTAITAGSLCSVPLGVAATQPETEALVYPNPTTGMLYITNLVKESEITILDITGRTIAKVTPGSTHADIDLSAYTRSNGTYIIRIVSGDKTTVSRVVLNR